MDAHAVDRRTVTCVAILILLAGCAGATTTQPPTRTATASPAPTPTAAASPEGSPTATAPTGDMTRGRSFHTATALVDGRVLTAGGYSYGYPIKNADLFDPSSGAFASTGSMSRARGFDTATRLVDGRVLVTGGDPLAWNFDGPYIDSAELYDLATGAFVPTGSMSTGRNLHTATLLLDGRVLIAGGDGRGTQSLSSAELYDPATGTFSPAGSMLGPRAFHTATRLADGRVLLTGGTSDGWAGANFLATAEIFDPTTDTFSATGPLAELRGSHTATLLEDGRVLITGGTGDGARSLDSAEIYDPKTGRFTLTGNMAQGRTFQEATLLSDGGVLVTGGDPAGWDYAGPFLASAEIYDPRTGTFRATGSMTDHLTNHTATLLLDGRVLIAGGFDGSADVTAAEIYDVTTGTFRGSVTPD